MAVLVTGCFSGIGHATAAAVDEVESECGAVGVLVNNGFSQSNALETVAPPSFVRPGSPRG